MCEMSSSSLALRSLVIFWGVFRCGSLSYAQESTTRLPRESARPKVATATRATEPPIIDGNLDERVWQRAAPLTDFVQTEPQEGAPASEKTEVRLLYDDKYLYVGVFCFDSDPSSIIVTDSRRDSDLSQTDSFRMIFDTFHDRQNGFVFGTTPSGVEYDAQLRDEGRSTTGTGGGAALGGGAQAGSGGGLNTNWDASWSVRARIVENGWTAEFQIPLRTLRYGPPPQVWGVNFARTIPRKRELQYWSPVERQYDIARVSSAGDLRGLDLRTPRNFKVLPYAIGSANRDFAQSSKSVLDGQGGFDVKFGVTPSMNMDFTYNTDFAQVEVDEQQINLTRYTLLFPEKRPFFLENAGLFAVGRGGDVDLFFSRRIGIADDGSFVPIRGGARLSGKMNQFNLGVLDIQTEDVGNTPANNFSAVRVSRELVNRSSLGAIFVGRAATGPKAGVADWNRTWGVDGKLGIGQPVTASGFIAKTETPGLSGGRQYAFNSGIEYKDRIHRTYLEYGEFGEQFNPEVGFLRRPGGSRRLTAGWLGTMRQTGVKEKGFRELLPHVIYTGYSNFDGSLQTATLHMDNHLDWTNGNYIAPAVDITWEGLDRPFEIYPGVIVPPGLYRSPHTAFRTNTDKRKSLFANFDWDYGGFLSGHQNSTSVALTGRQEARVQASVRWTRNDINLPQGAFVTNLGNLRATYNFSTRFYASTLIQYNDTARRWSTNLRVAWLNASSTGLYLVYNDTEAFNGLGPVNRSFIVKYSREVDVLR